MPARLQLTCDAPEIDLIVLKDNRVAIGRHPDNDIVIKDDLASRFHCVIEPSAQGYVLKDLQSRNGTRLNEKVVEASQVGVGDEIRVGSHVFRLEPLVRKGVRKSKGPPEEMQWIAQLVRVIEALPPKDVTPTESVTMIDAAGNETGALSGDSVGSAAVRLMLIAASKSRATDLHFEPKQEFMHVRLRVDGAMLDLIDLPTKVGELMLGLIKTACHIQDAGRDSILEGHFSVRLEERRIDYRASFTPSVHGRKLVLRALDLRDTPHSLNDLNMARYMLDRVRKVCAQDAGMVLVVGPTGSGKTTTLYNCMRDIDFERRNVITIEDPVEYHLEGITQIPADHDKGNTFHNLLRSVLRQDPDVILLGEIRDDETARTAMQAAMTGHLVFSTLHARDTISSIFRLLDLGVEPYLVANSINLVVAQRLLRVLCPHCKREVPLTPGQSTKMGRYAEGVRHIHAPTGCARCLRTGYRGRMATFELMDVNNELRDVILNKPSIQGLRKVIEQGLFTTLEQSAYQMVTRGLTSLEEVERVTGGL